MATILEKPSSRQLLSEIKEDELSEGGMAAWMVALGSWGSMTAGWTFTW